MTPNMAHDVFNRHLKSRLSRMSLTSFPGVLRENPGSEDSIYHPSPETFVLFIFISLFLLG